VTILLLLAAGYAALMLWRYGRRGWLAVAPGTVRIRSRADEAPRTPAQARAGPALGALGFRRLGSRDEEGPLGGLGLRSDAWAHEGAGAFADVFEEPARPGAPARLQLITSFPGGALALTANHPRSPRAGPSLEVGGFPDATVEDTWEAHRRAVARLAARHGDPTPATGLAARDALARAWYRGAGGRELRQRFGVYLGNALLAALILGAALSMLLRTRSVP
jgi:hypothetical protein